MGNSRDSIPATVIMALGLSYTFQQAGNQGHTARALETLEISGIVRHQAMFPETLPSHQDLPCGTTTRNALPRCIAPLDFCCPPPQAPSP